ncbi:uridine kinase [Serinicoccus sp. CUA-874]|uniref:uridine kinase family protein n=1 Tax=Serinicoccus sp. CUA-874 TaxID=1517939 RepID=UPI001EDB7451|nr:AAA family ATPase [Serinicoccus sp. CUA-874]
MDPAPPPARVLVLAGPSGAGKSRLASRLHARHGWPVVQLDDFYREGTDAGLPMSPLGLPDWDHVDSWDGEAALDALEQLCRQGTAHMPVYDISRSAVSGTHEVRRDGHTVVVAEGIFAAHVVAGLRERGLLAGAWCIRNQPGRPSPGAWRATSPSAASPRSPCGGGVTSCAAPSRVSWPRSRRSVPHR